MRKSPWFLVAPILAAILAVALLAAGCGKKSPTNPMNGSSGGTLFNSGTLNGPATFDHAFTTAGTFNYHCNFHRSMGMTGTVSVVAGGAASVTVTGGGTSFNPASV